MKAFTIHDWMVRDLELRDMAIVVFAFYYQHFKEGIRYEGTLEELAQDLGMTRQGLGKILYRMVEDSKLLCRERVGTRMFYYINDSTLSANLK